MINKNILVFSAFLLNVSYVTATSTDADNPFRTVRSSNTLPKDVCIEMHGALTKAVKPLKDIGKSGCITDAEILKLLTPPTNYSAAQVSVRAQALAAFWIEKMQAAKGTDLQSLRTDLEKLSKGQMWTGSLLCVDRAVTRDYDATKLPLYTGALGEFYRWIWEDLSIHGQVESCMVASFSFHSPAPGQTANDWAAALAPTLSAAGKQIMAGRVVDMTGLFTVENLTPYHVSKGGMLSSFFDRKPTEDLAKIERREMLAKILAVAYYKGDKVLVEGEVQIFSQLIEQYIAKCGVVTRLDGGCEVQASPESSAVLLMFPGGNGVLRFDSRSMRLSFH
jgi:hypothetical protein